MSFLPLVIWIVGFCFVMEYCEHNRRIDGRYDSSTDDENNMLDIILVKFFFVGILFFGYIGFTQ